MKMYLFSITGLFSLIFQVCVCYGLYVSSISQSTQLRDETIISKGAESLSQIEFRKPDDRLELFVRKLQGYINETAFDIEKFEDDIKTLQKQLLDIDIEIQVEEILKDHSEDENSLESRTYANKKTLSDKLRFAKFMLQAMSDSLHEINLLKSEESLVHHLLCSLILLNIRLLRLRNSHGAPDSSVPGYTEAISLSYQYLRMWRQTYQGLSEVPLRVSRKFAIHLIQAENTLQVLARYVS
ncbi:hypothetical protein OXX69_006821 [Metschnikowia pulcherrima]